MQEYPPHEPSTEDEIFEFKFEELVESDYLLKDAIDEAVNQWWGEHYDLNDNAQFALLNRLNQNKKDREDHAND